MHESRDIMPNMVESTDNKKKDVKKDQVKDKKQGKKNKPSDNEGNTNQGANQSFCEDQKGSKNIICKKDSEHERLDDDDEEGWCVQRNKKKTSHQSLSEEQEYHKNVQEKSKLSDSNSKQKKTHDNNNIDSHEVEDTHKSETKRRKRRRDKKKNSQEHNDIPDIDSSINDTFNETKVHDGNNIVHEENTLHLSNDDLAGRRDKKKKKNSQEPNDTSDLNSSIDDKFNETKVHDGNNFNLHEEETQHLSVNNDSKGLRNKNKNENSQKQNNISDIDSSIYDKLNQKKVHGGNKINLHEATPYLSVNEDSKVRRNKKKNKKTSRRSLSEELKSHKNVQKPNKWPEKDSIDDNMEQAHDRKKIDMNKDTRKSEGAERPRDKYKNNNSQKQSRFSDACVLEEIDEDIFKLSKEYSLAHCVAEDLRMGAGIAVDFKNIFGGVGKLVDQKLKIGDVGIVKRHDQYAFYLVTKKTSNGKPTMITMEKALISLLNKMKEYNLTKLGIPTIGCGLDKLDWSDTKSLIIKIFSGSGIHITVCVPSKLLDSKKSPRLTVYITPKNLWEMETETIIILFIDLEKTCNNNWTDHIVDKVDAKYPFKENLLRDIRNKKPDPGDIKIYNVKNEVITCIFTTENTYYGSLENGFKTIDHTLKGYKYLAIQSDSIDYPSDNFQRISWIVLISRSIIHSSELWLCGDVKQNNYKVYYDEYCKNILSMNNSFQYNSPSQNYNRYNDVRRSNFYTKEK
ncbi:MATH and LRR domain-containing protein PFE0570w isoform X3 [Acyrthosiphon pisum]|uniref:Macro domain-containing protein n=1 Tax=Acyrthosiphon pisum TaxID=7029 RepID=A0A8R2NNP2_ACYPI|nr:MATH and LRR domain-containing protein PFE0570w isoform X3 [Acyrthosiphon pisum]